MVHARGHDRRFNRTRPVTPEWASSLEQRVSAVAEAGSEPAALTGVP